MRNTNEQPNRVEQILALSAEDTVRAENIRAAAIIGSDANITRFVRERFLGEGSVEISVALQQGGAFATGQGIIKEGAFVSTDWWPGEHAKAVLEHEVMECIYRNTPLNAKTKLEELGLAGPLEEYFLGKPNYPHYLSVVYELKEAKELGILLEHLELHKTHVVKIRQATSYKESLARFDSDFRYAVRELL